MELIGNIVLADRILYQGSVRCEDGKIVSIGKAKEKPDGELPYIFPGLVDIHNHGAMGHDYMEATKEAFDAISGHLIRHGVTCAQCTTVSAPVDELKDFLRFFRENIWEKQPKGQCRFCGVHLEGPYISLKNRGAHAAKTLLTAQDGYEWILKNRDIIGEITVAPELMGMEQMIEALYGAGIVVSGGHDDAEPEEIERAARRGMRHCTHIYCAMSTLHKTGGQRKSGLCEYSMTHDTMTAEMIADNRHTPPLLAQMIYRCKGADRLCVVSDAIAPAGLPENGELFLLGTGEGGTRVFVKDGVAFVEDGSCYAGSVQALDDMIRNLVRDCNIPLVDAVRMASLTPAGVIGIEKECGSIAVGKRADFCVVDHKLRVVATIVGGALAYGGESIWKR